MTSEQKLKLNDFLVDTFNSILLWEEKALSQLENLSVREMHVIEAVSRLEKLQKNTMSQVASRLHISSGALTTSVNTLIKKGYLKRSADPNDRRIVLVFVTELGQKAEAIHEKFHSTMIEHVAGSMSEEDIDRLNSALEGLSEFFSKSATKRSTT